MKKGDMVRFAMWDQVNRQNSKEWPKTAKPHVGLLVEHDKLMGTVHILFEGELIKVRSAFVEKAGKKDFEKVTK